MVEGIATRGCVLEEIENAAHHSLKRNLAVCRRLRHGCDQTRDPLANTRGQVCLDLRISAIFVRRILVRGTRRMAFVKPPEREAIGRTPPTGFCTGEQTSGLACGEAFLVFHHSKVARLKEAAKMTGREISLDPIAQADQRATRTRKGGRNAR